jgi:hypothetical protein
MSQAYEPDYEMAFITKSVDSGTVQTRSYPSEVIPMHYHQVFIFWRSIYVSLDFNSEMLTLPKPVYKWLSKFLLNSFSTLADLMLYFEIHFFTHIIGLYFLSVYHQQINYE